MRRSLVLSAFLHLIVLAVVVFNISSSTKPPVDQPLAIKVVTPSEVSQLKAGNSEKANEDTKEATRAAVKTPPEEKKVEAASPVTPESVSKPVEKPAIKIAAPPPPKPKAAAAEPAREKANPDPAPEKQPQVKPTAVPPPVKRSDTRPEKQTEAPAAPRAKAEPSFAPEPDRATKRDATPQRPHADDLDAEPSPMAADSRRKFDPHRIAALLNRDPDAGAPPPARDVPQRPWRQPSSFDDQITGMNPDGPALARERYGAQEGRGDTMSANEIDAFRAQVSRCWTPPVGGLGADAIIVKLHIELSEDGRLVRPPQVANSVNSPFFTPAADSAVRAVLQCEPYRMPPEKFSQWHDMLLNFDPRQMYGG